ncbi:RICIN domain-containing protein [Streptomyces noursei]
MAAALGAVAGATLVILETNAQAATSAFTLENNGMYLNIGTDDDAAATTSPMTLTYDDATKEIRSSSDNCLDARRGSTTPGTKVIWYGCHGGGNQKWEFPEGKTVQLAGTNQCIQIASDNSIELQNCDAGNPKQQWEKKESTPSPTESPAEPAPNSAEPNSAH